jgi:hypothetical protein
MKKTTTEFEFKFRQRLCRHMESMAPECPRVSNDVTSTLIFSHTDTRADILIDLETHVIWVQPGIEVLQNAKVFHGVRALFDVVAESVPGYFGGKMDEAVLYMLVAQATAAKAREEKTAVFNELFLARYDEFDTKLAQVQQLQDELNATIIQYRVAMGLDEPVDPIKPFEPGEDEEDSMAFD